MAKTPPVPFAAAADPKANPFAKKGAKDAPAAKRKFTPKRKGSVPPQFVKGKAKLMAKQKAEMPDGDEC